LFEVPSNEAISAVKELAILSSSYKVTTPQAAKRAVSATLKFEHVINVTIPSNINI